MSMAIEEQYLNLLRNLLQNGHEKKDRTGTGTLSLFGTQLAHDMKQGFPLLTTKKLHWPSIVTELSWFLRGDTNIRYLLDNNCNVWNGDAYKGYERECGIHNVEPMEKDKFISAIKIGNNKEPNFIPDLTGYKLGDLGPIYGHQWRNWGYEPQTEERGYGIKGIDQITNSVNLLKTDPDSRRNKVSAWSVGELEQMTLPPCHTDFQFYTRELSFEERCKYAIKEGWMHWSGAFDFPETHVALNSMKTPKRAISLMWNQRSADTFLGVPFNIASYALLLEIYAKAVNMVPERLVGTLGDTHLYLNHKDQANTQIERTPFPFPKINLEGTSEYYLSILEGTTPITSPADLKVTLQEYNSHPAIKAPLSN